MGLRVPSRFAKATIESLDPKQFTPVIEYAADMLANIRRGRGLLLAGKPGVGKTWAITALTREYVLRGGVRRFPDYEFVTAPDFFEHLRDFDEDNWDVYRQRSWLDTYTTIPWLVINDLGKEYRGGKLGEVIPYLLGRVLRARSEKRLVTHVTTNLDSTATLSLYGESIMSLLSEMMTTVTVLGRDRRMAG